MAKLEDSYFELPLPEIHVWFIDLSSSRFDQSQLTDWLQGDELDQASRFAFPHLTRRFIIRRAALRMLLSRYAEISNQAIRFTKSATGKPGLADSTGTSSIQFNVSHSQDAILIAIARQPIGIDLEQVKLLTDLDAMISRTLSIEEQGFLRNCSQRERLAGFHKYWTCKEAVLKATGEGLSVPLDSVAVPLADAFESSGSTFVFQNGTDWKVECFEPLPGFAGAIAFEDPQSKLVFKNIEALPDFSV